MMKSKTFIALLFICAIASAASATVTDVVGKTINGTGAIAATSDLYQTGILKDWQALSMLFAIIGILLVALARMFAEPFNMPELKAWANIEMNQAIVTAAIVISTITVLAFIDTVVREQVNFYDADTCTASDFCLYNVSNNYMDDLIDLAHEGGREAFKQSITAGKSATYGTSLSCGTLIVPPCLWFFTKWSNNAFLMLDVERYNQEIEALGPIIYSLSVQKFFINNVNYYVAPSLLLIGIVARSFFLTRRIGGLMLATAMGLMFVLPMMYLWAAITLNVTIYGDKMFEAGDADCPSECGEVPPTCDGYDSCPTGCRELPYPYILGNCSTPEVELACMQLYDANRACFVVRDTNDLADCSNCKAANDPYADSSECKITPMLNAGTDCRKCFISIDDDTPANSESLPFSCRVALKKIYVDRNNPSLRTVDMSDRPEQCYPYEDDLGTAQYNLYMAALENCPANDTNAYESCMYVVPETADCECFDYDGDGSECCIDASDSQCREYSVQTATGGNVTTTVFFNCPSGQEDTCLNYTGAKAWDTKTYTCACHGPECEAPSEKCNNCLNVSYDFCLFNPQVNVNCPEECSETNVDKPVKLSAAEFAKKSTEGMYGREDIKNVSRLLLPAYFLPLVNIVVTLMFIRGFSPLFGGDIELPGYAKVL